MEIIFNEYSILKTIVDFLPEKDKIKFREINSKWLSIIDNSFDLSEVFGKLRYADYKLSSCDQLSKNEPSGGMGELSWMNFLSNFGIVIQLLLYDQKCFLKITSLAPHPKNYNLDLSEIGFFNSNNVIIRQIHKILFSDQYVFHFDDFDLLIQIDDNLEINWIKLPVSTHLYEENNFNQDFCKFCKERGFITKKFPSKMLNDLNNFKSFGSWVYGGDFVMLYNHQNRKDYQIRVVNLQNFSIIGTETSICSSCSSGSSGMFFGYGIGTLNIYHYCTNSEYSTFDRNENGEIYNQTLFNFKNQQFQVVSKHLFSDYIEFPDGKYLLLRIYDYLSPMKLVILNNKNEEFEIEFPNEIKSFCFCKKTNVFCFLEKSYHIKVIYSNKYI